MLKRLDWLDVHGAHGGGTSSDDSDTDSDVSSQASESDSDDQVSSESPASPAKATTKPAARVKQPTKTVAATVLPVEQGDLKKKRQRPNVTQQDSKQQKQIAVTGKMTTATANDKHGNKQQPAGQGQKQQQARQEQQAADKQQLSKSKQQHAAALSESEEGSDVDSDDDDDEDIAEYRREMMLGRQFELDGSDDDADDRGTDDSDLEHDEADGVTGSDNGEPELEVHEVERNWAEAEASQAVRGVALRCVPCRALLLNAKAYKLHLQSKKHVTALKHWDADEEGHFIAFAADTAVKKATEDEGETHAERLQRLKQQAAGQDAAKTAKAKKRQKRTPANKQPVEQAADADATEQGQPDKKRGKKGKRQRAAAKAAADAVKKQKVDKHHNTSAQRRKERRAAAAAAAAAAASSGQ